MIYLFFNNVKRILKFDAQMIQVICWAKLNQRRIDPNTPALLNAVRVDHVKCLLYVFSVNRPINSRKTQRGDPDKIIFPLHQVL